MSKKCGECVNFDRSLSKCNKIQDDSIRENDTVICCPFYELKPPTLFARITSSPETLAEETVYMDYNYDKQMCGFTSLFIDEIFLIEEQQGKNHEEKYFNARNKAIAAMVAKLKEVEK